MLSGLLFLAVELRGFEPLTSSMPWKRATNCAKAPRCFPCDSESLADGGRRRKIGYPAGSGEVDDTGRVSVELALSARKLVPYGASGGLGRWWTRRVLDRR